MQHVVCEYSFATSAPNENVGRIINGIITYEPNPSGPPVPQQLLYEEIALSPDGEKLRIGGGDEVTGTILNTSSYQFDTFDFKPRPASDFSLTAFGMPDLTKPTPTAHKGFDARWFFVFAVLALVGAVGFKVLAVRGRNAARNETPLGAS